MAENQNSTRMTRAAAKRKASATDENPVSKKRVVLGELPNISNVAAPLIPIQERETQKLKSTLIASKKKTKNAPTRDFESGSSDPQMCGPYVADICAYLREMEGKLKQRPLHDYIEKVQSDLTPNMRGVLMDWLVEVAEEYKLVSDTLYLTVSYVDRFLSVKTINRQRLQLVGVSAMLIASKYEEISPPKVEDFVYITDNTFTRQDVVSMEADILLALQFELGCPTIKTFLRRFTRVAQEDFSESRLQIEFLCCYLSELSLLDYSCVKFLPSLLAASAVFLARFIIRPKQHPWNQMLEEYTKYKASDLKEPVGIIHDLYLSRKGNSLEAVRNKYKQHKFKCVATMPVSPELPLAFFEDVIIREKA
ncbi:Cyclin-A3-4 [Raphanus sativus]|uniref:Cyclin-A3-4 isoform X3 n=1 Tax=Raphanus sativus TaxID=3726 RepID=A0A6J0KW44_RAPSA|nr:cyclin-A3-4 isoform X3 [Raphanus sativus]KAJ4881714.1 Cyclin-A3-4 [Raphanus sativus]